MLKWFVSGAAVFKCPDVQVAKRVRNLTAVSMVPWPNYINRTSIMRVICVSRPTCDLVKSYDTSCLYFSFFFFSLSTFTRRNEVFKSAAATNAR